MRGTLRLHGNAGWMYAERTTMAAAVQDHQATDCPSASAVLDAVQPLAPQHQGILHGLRVVRMTHARNRKPEPFVEETRRVVGTADLESSARCADACALRQHVGE